MCKKLIDAIDIDGARNMISLYKTNISTLHGFEEKSLIFENLDENDIFRSVVFGSQAETREILLCSHFFIQFFELIRKHVLTVVMDSDGVIKGCDIFKNKSITVRIKNMSIDEGRK